jgi:hypothetical protein
MNDYLYIATDVECDGVIPGDYSMLSIGSVAFNPEQGIIDTYSANIAPLPGASQHPRTMAFWSRHPEQWNALQTDQLPPEEFCKQYLDWLDSYQDYHLVFTSDYVGFDLQFVRWYLVHFCDRDPFWVSQLDLMSYASALTGKPQPEHQQRKVPEHWLEGTIHDHTALSDAMTHAKMCLAMMADRAAAQPSNAPEAFGTDGGRRTPSTGTATTPP